jgi:hypothetical protein
MKCVEARRALAEIHVDGMMNGLVRERSVVAPNPSDRQPAIVFGRPTPSVTNCSIRDLPPRRFQHEVRIAGVWHVTGRVLKNDLSIVVRTPFALKFEWPGGNVSARNLHGQIHRD